MTKYTVRVSGLTNMLAYLLLEAETPEAARLAAMQRIEDSSELIEWEHVDDNEPIRGTEEVTEIDDLENGEEVLGLPQVSAIELSALIAAKANDKSGASMLTLPLASPQDTVEALTTVIALALSSIAHDKSLDLTADVTTDEAACTLVQDLRALIVRHA